MCSSSTDRRAVPKEDMMQRESASYKTLSSLVQDKRLLKDLAQMGLFKHTGKELAI